MMINSYQRSSTRSEVTTSDWSIKPYLNWPQQQYEPSTWVQLLEPPSPYCSDTALLLCQESKNQWLGWIPDYGEVKLYTHQFCPAS